jgi:hypothetical protein
LEKDDYKQEAPPRGSAAQKRQTPAHPMRPVPYMKTSEEKCLRKNTSTYRNILRYIDPLLGKDRETNKETTAVARQRPAHNGNTVGSGVFYVVRSDAI